VHVESRALRHGAVVVKAAAGEGDDDHVPAPGMLANPAAGLIAVDLRESDVEQDHFGSQLFRELYGFKAVVCHMRGTAIHVEEDLQHLYGVAIVIDDQDLDRRSRLHAAFTPGGWPRTRVSILALHLSCRTYTSI